MLEIIATVNASLPPNVFGSLFLPTNLHIVTLKIHFMSKSMSGIGHWLPQIFNWLIREEILAQNERSHFLLSDISRSRSILIHAVWDDRRTECLHSQRVFSQQMQQEAVWCLWCGMSITGLWCQQMYSRYPTCAFLGIFLFAFMAVNATCLMHHISHSEG